MKGLGITATDTDIGKTIISGALGSYFAQKGFKTGVFKPAASGCIKKANGDLLSTDAEFLMKSVKMKASEREKVVPYVLEPALAPAEASVISNIKLDPKVMLSKGKRMLESHDITIVEGVGGISAPLTQEYLVKDFFVALNISIIIVVKAVLGNVNHAVLTAEYCKNHGLKVLGFIVNSWDENTAGVLEKSNLFYYEKLTGLPILGKLPKLSQEILTGDAPDKLATIVAENFQMDKIMELLGGVSNE